MTKISDIADLASDELEKLPEHSRAILVARQYGADYVVLARDLNIPLGTVRSRLNRARAAVLKARETAAHSAA